MSKPKMDKDESEDDQKTKEIKEKRNARITREKTHTEVHKNNTRALLRHIEIA